MHDKYHRRASTISTTTGLGRGSFPLTYLGVPIFYGRTKSVYFEYLVDKIRRALDGWRAKILSFGGRITLIKSMLQSFPVYTLTSTLVPKNILRRMESLMAQFLWNVKEEKQMHWINWTSTCYPISEGGLGFKQIAQIQNGLQAKLLWLIVRGGSLWAKFMRAKYFNEERLLNPTTASPLWHELLQHHKTLMSLSRWVVGSGEILLGPLPVDRNLTIAQGMDIISELWDNIPSRLHAQIRTTSITPAEPDSLIFTPTIHGKFTTKEYDEHTR